VVGPIDDDAVHVWRARVPPDAGSKRFQRVLTSDELAQAGRFRVASAHDQFVFRRATLRMLLSGCLDVDPNAIRFTQGPKGKPGISGPVNPSDLRFNLSHSRELVVIALARGRELGVDVERIRPEVETSDISRHFFSPREVAALEELPATLRTEAFYACWTRKEAFIKATGEGLSRDLRSFDVSVAPREPAALLATRDDPSERERWTLVNLEVDSDYFGALVVEGQALQLRYEV
jgi:4'-phosphopantetheinyl transferase